MKKSSYTHFVYLNSAVDSKIWSLYAPFCAEIPVKNTKYPVLLCSNIDISSVPYLQVTVHVNPSPVNLKIPNSLVLQIREVSSEEKKVVGFARAQ
jgi:hypothetical protein